MRRTFVLHLALAAVLLAGCSGQPAPREPDSTEGASPEATATPPPLPEAATQETAEGAASFVDYYLAVLNYAAHTGDTDALRALSDDDCGSCEKYAGVVDATHQAGGAYTGGDWSVSDVATEDVETYWTVAGPVTTAAGQTRTDAKSEFQQTAESTTKIEFVLVHEGSNWIMYSFAEAKQ